MEITKEQMKNMMAQLKPIPLPEVNGIKFPSFIHFRTKGAEKAISDIVNIPSRESDILICTYVKSGVHWINEIITMLKHNTTELSKRDKSQMTLEIVHDLSVLDGLPSPRILNTHFMFEYLPKKHIENRSKIVHLVRNPKDICVSLHHHAQKDVFVNLNVPWEEYFETWMSGKMPFGSWYQYELGMEQAEKDNPGMIYTCYYEDIKKNPEKEIKKLADFLEVDCTDQTIKNIVQATSFQNMQKNKFDFTSLMDDGKGFIYRKGEIGDWKNHFTVAQNERFDAQYNDKMNSSKYKITFE